MCRVSRCCCCFSLKTGLYIAVGYTSALSVFAIGAVIWLLTSGLSYVRNIAVDKMEKEYGDKFTHEQIIDAVDSAIDMERIFSVISLIMYAIWLLFAILMPVGLVQKKRGFLMPWIVMTWIITVLVGLAIANFLVGLSKPSSNPYIWIQVTIYVLTFVANACSICGVTSYYKNDLKEEMDTPVAVGAPPPYGQFKFHSMA